MFDGESKLFKKRGNYVVATEKNSVHFVEALLLRNKKTIIHKRESRNRNTRSKNIWSLLRIWKIGAI